MATLSHHPARGTFWWLVDGGAPCRLFRVGVVHINVQTAASRHERRCLCAVVALSPRPRPRQREIDIRSSIPAATPQPAVKRLRDRYPRLQPWLDRGAVGNTVGGLSPAGTRRTGNRTNSSGKRIATAPSYNQASAAARPWWRPTPARLAAYSYTFGTGNDGQGRPAGGRRTLDLVWRQR